MIGEVNTMGNFPEDEALEKYISGELTWAELSSYPRLKSIFESVDGITTRIADKVEGVMSEKKNKRKKKKGEEWVNTVLDWDDSWKRRVAVIRNQHGNLVLRKFPF